MHALTLSLLILVLFAAGFEAKGGGGGGGKGGGGFGGGGRSSGGGRSGGVGRSGHSGRSHGSNGKSGSHRSGSSHGWFRGGGAGGSPGRGSSHKDKDAGIGGVYGGSGSNVKSAMMSGAGGFFMGHMVGSLFGAQHLHWNRRNMSQYYGPPYDAYLGHYGYYENGTFHRCPPPKVVNVNGSLFVPKDQNKDYDTRCQYFERQPPVQQRTYNSFASRLVVNWPMIGLLIIVLIMTNSRPKSW